MNQETHDFADCWGIHCEREEQPTLRAWAATEAEAAQRLEELRAADPQRERTEYWVMRMTKGQLSTLKQVGFVPADA